jgi:hypothetical protein
VKVKNRDYFFRSERGIPASANRGEARRVFSSSAATLSSANLGPAYVA